MVPLLLLLLLGTQPVGSRAIAALNPPHHAAAAGHVTRGIPAAVAASSTALHCNAGDRLYRQPLMPTNALPSSLGSHSPAVFILPISDSDSRHARQLVVGTADRLVSRKKEEKTRLWVST